MNKQHLAEAEEFRAKHGLSPVIPAEEISEVMSLVELGLYVRKCEECHEGYHSHCNSMWCECKTNDCIEARAEWALMRAEYLRKHPEAL